MTLVSLKSNGTKYSVKANQHTDPRVCAGISALLFTIAGYVSNQPSIKVKEITLEPGDSYLEWDGGCFARAAYEMAQIGFMQLEAGYPEDMKVNI